MLCLMCGLPLQGKVFDLKCEGLTAPLGIDTTTPHFSWKHELSHNRQSQTAYQIQVASDSADLARGVADLWDSGQVTSGDQVMIPYQGIALQQRQLCYWRVRTWDERGQCSPWSGIEHFAVGILGGMNGHYIGNWQGDTLATTPMFRKTIIVARGKQGIAPVFIHINSLGYHDLLVNGRRVGDLVLQPAVSQLDRHSLMQDHLRCTVRRSPIEGRGLSTCRQWLENAGSDRQHLGNRFQRLQLHRHLVTATVRRRTARRQCATPMAQRNHIPG